MSGAWPIAEKSHGGLRIGATYEFLVRITDRRGEDIAVNVDVITKCKPVQRGLFHDLAERSLGKKIRFISAADVGVRPDDPALFDIRYRSGSHTRLVGVLRRSHRPQRRFKRLTVLIDGECMISMLNLYPQSCMEISECGSADPRNGKGWNAE